MEEYYIRKEDDEEARGPFTIEQLSSLVEAEQVDRETFYYESSTEEWVQVSTNEQLVATLFPEKKKLKIKPKEEIEIDSLNVKQEDEAPIAVQDMLAAAEGKTSETSDKRDRSDDVARATNVAVLFNAFILLITAGGLLVPSLNDLDPDEILKSLANPLFILGVIDLVLCVVLFLQVSMFTLIRFRAAFGLGFYGWLYLAQDNELLLLAAIFTSAGLFLNTLFRNLLGVIIASSFVGLVGALAFAYLMIL
jgi:hypothetical protein